jgi:hypothetical protein
LRLCKAKQTNKAKSEGEDVLHGSKDLG